MDMEQMSLAETLDSRASYGSKESKAQQSSRPRHSSSTEFSSPKPDRSSLPTVQEEPFTRRQAPPVSRTTERQISFLNRIAEEIAAIESALDHTPSIEEYEKIRHHLEATQSQLKGTSWSKGARARKDALAEDLHACSSRLETAWKPAINRQLGAELFRCDHHYDRPVDRYSPYAQLFMLLLMIVRLLMNVSRRDTDFILGVITISLSFVGIRQNVPVVEETKGQLPQTVQTVMSKFGLDGKCVIYCVCPDCDCTYPPDVNDQYPRTCSGKPTPESRCSAALLSEEGKPLKTFSHHLFADYLAGLLSRADLEDDMDEACARFVDRASTDPRPRSAIMTSPFDAEFVKTFIGPDGKPFISVDHGELRLLFSLCLDFFQPEGTSRRGKHQSIGLISLACLNLSPDVRYRPENMWADIIPGPREPSLTATNHYLRPLVDEMSLSWHRGHRFSRTANCQQGRIARGAIAIGVFDLPAARKTAAFAPHGHRIFCHVCNAWDCEDADGHSVKLDKLRRRTDHSSWALRDVHELRRAAEAWRDAPTVAEQESIFKKHGVRYSELWRLSYWDPTRMMIVDPMHAVLEGVARFHTLKALRLTESDAKARVPFQPAFTHPFRVPHIEDDIISETAIEDAPAANGTREFGHPFTKTDVTHVNAIHKLLTAPFENTSLDPEVSTTMTPTLLHLRLQARPLGALAYVAEDLDVDVVGTGRRGIILKCDLNAALIRWVGCSYNLPIRF
jgi:hypothetical protein